MKLKSIFAAAAISTITILYSLGASAENNFTSITVDAKDNCCATREDKVWKERAVKVDLTPGNYVFTPASGAMSKWKSDRVALMQGRKPWSFCVLIGFVKDDQFNEHVLGIDQKHDSMDAAFEANRNAKVSIALSAPTTVYFWIEDEYENRDACDDNRGAMVVNVQKLK